MREQFFTTGIVRCERSRAWWQKALWVLAALLVAWLLSGCEMRGEGPVLEEWQKGLVIGLLALGTVAVGFLAFRTLRAQDEEGAVGWFEIDAAAEAFPDPDTVNREQRTGDPLAVPLIGMARADLARILNSCLVELWDARAVVLRAQDNLSVEDYGEALTGVEVRLTGVMKCLGNVRDRCDVSDEEAEMCQVWQSYQAEHAKFERNLGLLNTLVQHMARCGLNYQALAAGYKPEHGGYAV